MNHRITEPGVQPVQAPYFYRLGGGSTLQFVQPAADGSTQAGATTEEVLEVLIHRVSFQNAAHPHPENTELLLHLTGALACQRARVRAMAAEAAPVAVERFGILMVPCTSSNLEAHGYDGLKSVLALQFRGGRIYHYRDVPQHVYDGLLQSESKGSYAAREITGKFEPAPLPQETAAA